MELYSYEKLAENKHSNCFTATKNKTFGDIDTRGHQVLSTLQGFLVKRKKMVLICTKHGDCGKDTKRANLHCQDTACTRSFNVGLTSAEGQKLESFK